ncbi:MAG: SDR family NAD(P)-dependent oxidoreductase [Chitinophagaceae bacterium]
MRFENKVCIVTGGSSGIGRSTVLQLIKEGGLVAFLNRNKEEGNDLMKEITAGGSSNGLYIKTDVGIPEEIQNAVK